MPNLIRILLKVLIQQFLQNYGIYSLNRKNMQLSLLVIPTGQVNLGFILDSRYSDIVLFNWSMDPLIHQNIESEIISRNCNMIESFYDKWIDLPKQKEVFSKLRKPFLCFFFIICCFCYRCFLKKTKSFMKSFIAKNLWWVRIIKNFL